MCNGMVAASATINDRISIDGIGYCFNGYAFIDHSDQDDVCSFNNRIIIPVMLPFSLKVDSSL